MTQDSLDHTDPESVAKAVIAAVINRDYQRMDELTVLAEKEQAALAQEGVTYPEMLELLWSYPDKEIPGGRPLPEAVKELYTGALEMHIGEVPDAGKIAAAVIGPVDPAGEEVMVVVLFLQLDGTWRIMELPKTLPVAMLEEIG